MDELDCDVRVDTRWFAKVVMGGEGGRKGDGGGPKFMGCNNKYFFPSGLLRGDW